MQQNASALAQRYLAALRDHLGARARGAATARALGRDALASGFGPLDLAKIHDEALAAMAATPTVEKSRHDFIRRAGKFFTEALVPLENGHRAARASLAQLKLRAAALRLQAAVLARGNRQLQREVVRRKAGEAAVRHGREQIHRMFVESQLARKKLRHLTHQVLAAHENERRRISRELHDEVAQTLVGITVELATLGATGAINPRTLRARIARAQRLVGKSVDAVQQFACELRPAVLDHLGLIPALQVYLERLAARKKLIINLTAFAGIEAVENEKRTVLFRVAQEALANVVRHARACTVNLIISEIPGAVRMEVRDDGKSFPVRQTLSSPRSRRIGLLGMQERVEMAGGTLHLESARGQGTSIRVEIPFVAGGSQ